MKNNVLKFSLAASLILNLTVFATAGYHYYQQSLYWVSPFGQVMEKDKFLFEELSLKPEQLAAMKNKAVLFRGEIEPACRCQSGQGRSRAPAARKTSR